MECWKNNDNFLTEALVPELLSSFVSNKKRKASKRLTT